MNRENVLWVFFEGRRKLQSCCQGFWETLGTGFSFSFGLLPEEPELTDSDVRPAKETHFKGDVSAVLPIAEMPKLLTPVRSSFFGITTLTDSETLTGGQSNLYVVCMYQLFEKKKKKLQNHQFH